MLTSQSEPRIRVAAIIMRGDSILLVRHEKNDRTYWLLPGGGVELGETLCEALEREMMEEANVRVRPDRLVLVNDSIPSDGSRHVVNVYFTADLLDDEVGCNVDERVKEMRFMPLSSLPELIFYPDVRDSLMVAIEQAFPNHAEYLGNLWKD